MHHEPSLELQGGRLHLYRQSSSCCGDTRIRAMGACTVNGRAEDIRIQIAMLDRDRNAIYVEDTSVNLDHGRSGEIRLSGDFSVTRRLLAMASHVEAAVTARVWVLGERITLAVPGDFVGDPYSGFTFASGASGPAQVTVVRGRPDAETRVEVLSSVDRRAMMCDRLTVRTSVLARDGRILFTDDSSAWESDPATMFSPARYRSYNSIGSTVLDQAGTMEIDVQMRTSLRSAPTRVPLVELPELSDEAYDCSE